MGTQKFRRDRADAFLPRVYLEPFAHHRAQKRRDAFQARGGIGRPHYAARRGFSNRLRLRESGWNVRALRILRHDVASSRMGARAAAAAAQAIIACSAFAARQLVTQAGEHRALRPDSLQRLRPQVADRFRYIRTGRYFSLRRDAEIFPASKAGTGPLGVTVTNLARVQSFDAPQVGRAARADANSRTFALQRRNGVQRFLVGLGCKIGLGDAAPGANEEEQIERDRTETLGEIRQSLEIAAVLLEQGGLDQCRQTG